MKQGSRLGRYPGLLLCRAGCSAVHTWCAANTAGALQQAFPPCRSASSRTRGHQGAWASRQCALQQEQQGQRGAWAGGMPLPSGTCCWRAAPDRLKPVHTSPSNQQMIVAQTLPLLDSTGQPSGMATPPGPPPVKMEWLREDSMFISWLPTLRCRTARDSTCKLCVWVVGGWGGGGALESHQQRIRTGPNRAQAAVAP